MRHRGRTDGNQALIVRELRQLGASVEVLSNHGNGCPDLLVGFAGENFLFEIKSPNQPSSARKLTADERQWHAAWSGQVTTITSTEEALNLMTASVRVTPK